jgi:HPt (histidine-containing phosphotransfer) domain-containing protein
MIKQKETGPIRELAHAIKGSAATIGARKLSDAAKELQYAADLEKVGEYQELFQKINSEFDRFEVLYSRQNWINIIKSNT